MRAEERSLGTCCLYTGNNYGKFNVDFWTFTESKHNIQYLGYCGCHAFVHIFNDTNTYK